MSHGFNDDGLGEAMARSGQDDRIRAMERKLELYERVIRAFVENPFVWQAASFQPLVKELGYEIVTNSAGRDAKLVRTR
jgi:hypothetical protein